MLPSFWEIFFLINIFWFFPGLSHLKMSPKQKGSPRQPKATQPRPAAEESREDGKRDEGEMAAERGNGLCSLLAGHLQRMW